MGREHETSPVSRDHSLQPFDGGDIEMIRGLVEEQEVGLADHGPGQQDSTFLSARQRIEGGFGCDAGFLEGARHLPVTVPALGVGFPHTLKALRHDVVHATGQGIGKHLGQQGDPESRRPLELPGVRFAPAGEDGEEGGLPRAVASRQTDPVTGRDFELDIREQDLVADIGANPSDSHQAHAIR